MFQNLSCIREALPSLDFPAVSEQALSKARQFISPSLFKKLYFYRWPVETKYKELKSRLSLDECSGAITVSVFQEFFINMLLSNLASLIKNQADDELLISPRSSNKYRYQANRAFVIGRMKRILRILST